MDYTHAIVAGAHVVILGPLLVAIGLGWLGSYRWIAAILGAFIVVYHAYKAYTKCLIGHAAWINWIHVLFVGPPLIALGSLPQPPRYLYEGIIMLGVAAIGYHGLNLLTGR